jgi:hypothetical protein
MFKLLRWMKNIHQLTWDLEILYADKSSKDKQLLIRPLLPKNQKLEHGGRLKFKIEILFYGDDS